MSGKRRKLHHRVSLSGDDWIFKEFLGEDWVWRHVEKPESRDVRFWKPGTVPGSVHHDLLKLGEIPNPYVDRNSLLVEWVPERTWVYKKTFFVDPAYRGRRVRLTFKGIDYEATIFLNGKRLGHHKGMFVPAQFEVSGELKYGEENLLVVVIEPAPDEQPQVSKTSRVTTHKSRMTYWWDFCPRMIHIGIWDDVVLEVTGAGRMEDIFVRPQLSPAFDHADLSVSACLSSTERSVFLVEVEIRHQGEVVKRRQTRHAVPVGETNINLCIPLERPRLWWPNGMGEPHLYEATVRIIAEQTDEMMDEQTVSFGIRDVQMVRNERSDPEALPYTFVINGRKTFINGWNWVPIDVMYGVNRPEKLAHLLNLAKEVNVNLLRVWGGGLIEKDSFYDECNRKGIMVWQEFIQSSSGIENRPSRDPGFIEMMRREAEIIVKKKRNHPSLVLWCGGNELHAGETELLDDREPVLGALHEVVKRLDPDRHWLPTSPSGKFFSNHLKNIAADPQGLHDVHGPWEHQGLVDQYRLYNAGTSLFHSEFGVEGITNLKAIEATISPRYRWPATKNNPVWFHRGAWWINEPFVQEAFGGLRDLPSLVRASQFLQAEGLRYAVESNRRRQFQNSGTLPWQFNEPFPNGYCTSAVDYFGEPKMAYYAVAHAYRPILLSARFERQVWAGQAWFEAGIWLSNATPTAQEGNVVAQIRGSRGEVFGEWQVSTRLPVNSSAPVIDYRLPLAAIEDDLFILDLRLLSEDGKEMAQSRYLFSRTDNLAPMLRLPATKLSIRQQTKGDLTRLTVVNAGERLALYVRLEDEREHERKGFVTFNTNHILLFPDEQKQIDIRWNQVPTSERSVAVQGWNTNQLVVSAEGGKEEEMYGTASKGP